MNAGGTGLTLARLDPDDWRVWRAVRLAALAEAPDAFLSRLEDWQGSGDTEERWRSRLTASDDGCMVAMRGGRPVGMVSADPDHDRRPVTWLQSMWVDPGVRGGGVVEELVRGVCAVARERGHDRVVLEVRETNERAQAAYRRLGFAPTGEEREVAGHREQTWALTLSP